MGFQRWGMQDAVPVFQVYDRYEGPVHKRGSHGMVRADRLSKSYPGQEHHHGFDNYISHPDARYIAEGRELFHQLIEVCAELQARAEKAERERDEYFAHLKGRCFCCVHKDGGFDCHVKCRGHRRGTAWEYGGPEKEE